MKQKIVKVREFKKLAEKSLSKVYENKNRLDTGDGQRLLLIAALDRLEYDGDYRAILNNSEIPEHRKVGYIYRRQCETMREITKEVTGERANGFCK